MNKSKARGKMYALFNLRNSRKFMAFYSVSFPLGTSDNCAFVCWNYWLTMCRKRFNLNNYVWVSERQENGTIHFHMLTNNWLPISIVNRAMAIIIDNQVAMKNCSWGEPTIYKRKEKLNGITRIVETCSYPCLDSYNGVDVDSVYNSKRHKKSGKMFTQAELRQWLTKYITKYITKNTSTFAHLCWHCSRTVSILFTSELLLFSDRRQKTDFLPTNENLYMQFKSEFNHTCVFLFVPPDHIFEKIRAYNNLLTELFAPVRKYSLNGISYKSKTI